MMLVLAGILKIRSDTLKLRLATILTISIMAHVVMTTRASVRAHGNSYAPVTAQGAYTPSAGSAERQAIMDALRAKMKRNDSRELTFVVQYLKVHNGWAWVTVNPQSPSGDQQYESESALLRKRGKTWRVYERSAGGDAAYFKKLKAKYKSVPSDIFP